MNTVLYITYTNMKNVNSGSQVRPIKIYEAFQELDYEVKLLKGEASRKNKKERINNIKQIEQWLKNNQPQYCYIESPSDPIIFRRDRKLIKLIHRKGIKIGYFYRDAYYKLGKDYIFNNKKIGIISKRYLKYIYYKFLFWRDEQLLKKYVDIVYFPSESMAKFFNFKDMRILPPAGEMMELNKNDNANSVIYVGGISKNYGIDILLESMEIINKKKNIDLILVCRDKEINNIPQLYLKCNWLKIYHVSGKEKLKKLYEKSKLAVIPKKPNIYNNFAVSVKLFEYMSYNLPIIAIDTTETTRLIQRFNIGLISNDNAEEFANTILKVYNDRELYNELVNNVKNALHENLWTNRIRKITKDLTNL